MYKVTNEAYKCPLRYIEILPMSISLSIKVWRYQKGYQKTKIEEGQTIQWSKEKGQKCQPMMCKSLTVHRKLKIKQHDLQ